MRNSKKLVWEIRQLTLGIDMADEFPIADAMGNSKK